MSKQNVGGQAVIEGVMMRNGDKYSIAIRKPDKEIILEEREYKSISKRFKILGLPFLRGVVAFIESMIVGMKILTFSAEFFEVEDAKESKFDVWLEKKFGDKTDSIIIAISIVLAMIMAIGLFVLLPLALSQLLKPILPSIRLLNLTDGLIRVAVMLLYIFAISRMKDIQRVFQYHGAEHKSINCLESGLELTVENCRNQTRLHKRCGTSFLLYVVLISVFVMMIVNVEGLIARFIVRLLMFPVIAGISYEVLKFLGNTKSTFFEAFTKPGLLLQKLTTQEPDDEQLEVALVSLKSVLVEDKVESVVTEDEVESVVTEDEVSHSSPA